MYSTRTLYYLNQMQIRPWVKREAVIASHEMPQKMIKLFVFISAGLSDKARSLVQQLIAFINIPEQELAIIPVQDTRYLGNLEQKKPSAILILGLDGECFKQALNISCPVLTSADPEYLIANPSEKRKVFRDLNSLKHLLF